jgi:hypothetical protein
MKCCPSAIGRLQAQAAVSVGLAILLHGIACFGQATQPATAPALSPAELSLMKKLETGNWRDRRAAEDQLQNLDDSVTANDQAESTLRSMLARTTSPEAAARLSAALSALPESRAVGPSLITLHMTDAPIAKVYQELFRQARWPMKTSPDDLLDHDTSTVTVNVDHQPFWQVFPKLSEQTGLTLGLYNGQGVALVRQTPLPNGPTDVQGAFMTVAMQLTYMHSIALATNQYHDNASCAMEVQLFAEPKIEMLRISREVKVLEATDDHGNSLRPDGPGDTFPQPASGNPYSLEAPLKFPAKNPGTRLVRFRGSIIATVQTAMQRIEVPDLLNAKTRPLALGKSLVTFVGCRSNGDNYTVTLTTPLDAQNDWQRIFEEAQQRLHVYDADGNELDRNGVGDSIDNNLVTITLDITKATTPDGKPQGPPTKLVWEVATSTRDITIPVEFKNLNMNIVGEQDHH